MNEEVWKVIPGYEGLYEASNLGNIRSLDRYENWGSNKMRFRPGKNMLLNMDKQGRLRATLSIEGKQKTFQVHRLVAAAFKGLDLNNKKCCVCHKNDMPTDNSLVNLFLGSQSDNIMDMYNKKRGVDNSGENHGMNKLKESQIVEIKRMIKSGIRNKEIANKFFVDPSLISSIRIGRLWKHVTV